MVHLHPGRIARRRAEAAERAAQRVEAASFDGAPTAAALASRRRMARDLFEAAERAIEDYRAEAIRARADERSFDLVGFIEAVVDRVRACGASLELKFDTDAIGRPRLVGQVGQLAAAVARLLLGAAAAAQGGRVEVRVGVFEHERQAVVDIQASLGCAAGQPPGRLGGRERWVDRELSFVFSPALSRSLDGDAGATGALAVVARLRLPTARPDSGFRLGALDVAAPDDALRGLRVLVVEDVPLNRELIQMLLAPYGCDTDGACDGWTALDALEARAYDIILMDLNMPNMDGFEAIERIRARGDGKAATPILAVTGRVLAVDVAKIGAAGADGHLSKPFVTVDLVAAMLRCLERAGRRGRG